MSAGAEECVTFPSQNNNGHCSGVLIGASSTSSGGVIVLHERWGLTPAMRDIAKRISQESELILLIPDLYRGKLAETKEKAEQYKDELNWDSALADISGAAEFLRTKGCSKIGVVGQCMGGALALAAAMKLEDVVTAAVAFYGIPERKEWDLKRIEIPLQIRENLSRIPRKQGVVILEAGVEEAGLGYMITASYDLLIEVELHFGVHDKEWFSCRQSYEPLRDSLVENDADMEFYEYDAEHDFANPSQPNFLRGAFSLSFNRCCEFLTRHLS